MRIPPIPATLFAAAIAFGHLQAQEDPSIDREAIMKELEEIEAKRDTQWSGEARNLVSRLQSAAQNEGEALDLFYETMLAIQFSGKTRENSQLRDWKEKFDEVLDDRDFRRALQLHCRYLVLSLNKAFGASDEELVPSLLRYTDEIEGLDTSFLAGKNSRPFKWLDGDIAQSPLARRYELGRVLGQLEDWHQKPLDYHGIFAKSILPYFRETKDSRAIDYWDRRIVQEQENAQASGGNFQSDRFEAIRRPELLWSRAREFGALGQTGRSINEMLSVVRRYPMHPSFDEWVGEIRSGLGDGIESAAASTGTIQE